VHYPVVAAAFHIRRFPHLHCLGHPTFLTWRLAGSLPKGRCFPSGETSGKAFVALDRLLDNARAGPLYLSQPPMAMVVDAITCRDGGHYRLHNYAVMSNRVHLLITPRVAVSQLMQSLKRFTASQGNRMLGLTGRSFWQDESYDRLVRDDHEFERIAYYIDMNPVRAGMAARPEEFPWSSAWAD